MEYLNIGKVSPPSVEYLSDGKVSPLNMKNLNGGKVSLPMWNTSVVGK